MAPPAAPAASASFAFFDRRQEACALLCLTTTDAGTCAPLDPVCLCASTAWGELVLSCLQASCENETSLDTAYSQLQLYCNSASTPFTLSEPTYTGTMTASSIAAPTAAVSTHSSATGVVSTSKPVNVSTIMASVCSLLFVIALLVGWHGVKEKLARQREQSTMKPSSWTGGKQAAPGQKLSSGAPGGSGSAGPSSKAKPSNASVGAHSSLFGGVSSAFDSAGYADLKMEERQHQARRARLETETQRRENLDTLFTSSAKGSSSRSRSSLASVAKSTSKGDFTLDGSDDDDDENAQYVTIPELGKGLSAGGEPGIEPSPLTASTFAPSDGEGGWGIISSPTTTAVGDSTVALNKAEPIFRSNRE